jgi:hypothetical protein
MWVLEGSKEAAARLSSPSRCDCRNLCSANKGGTEFGYSRESVEEVRV